eukprot:768500-Hanusia_phi.AAC.5
MRPRVPTMATSCGTPGGDSFKDENAVTDNYRSLCSSSSTRENDYNEIETLARPFRIYADKALNLHNKHKRMNKTLIDLAGHVKTQDEYVRELLKESTNVLSRSLDDRIDSSLLPLSPVVTPSLPLPFSCQTAKRTRKAEGISPRVAQLCLAFEPEGIRANEEQVASDRKLPCKLLLSPGHCVKEHGVAVSISKEQPMPASNADAQDGQHEAAGTSPCTDGSPQERRSLSPSTLEVNQQHLEDHWKATDSSSEGETVYCDYDLDDGKVPTNRKVSDVLVGTLLFVDDRITMVMLEMGAGD